MVNSSTQHLPKLFHTSGTQTVPMRHSLNMPQLERIAAQAEAFVTTTSSLRSTLYRELGSRLKMPNSMEAHMELKVDFPGIPTTGWKKIFPNFEWHSSEDGTTDVGMVLEPAALNLALTMERCSPQVKMLTAPHA